MDKNCPLKFRRKLKTRKSENLKIARFPAQENEKKVKKYDRQGLFFM